MNSTRTNLINKICAILAIFALTVSDFVFVGKSAVSYAIDAVKTNHANVEFSAYFQDESGEKIQKIFSLIFSFQRNYDGVIAVRRKHIVLCQWLHRRNSRTIDFFITGRAKGGRASFLLVICKGTASLFRLERWQFVHGLVCCWLCFFHNRL